jgi:acyl-CoA thioester hydrolase
MPLQVTTEPPRRTAPPARSDFRFWTREKSRNADTDQFRHINNAVISTFLEAARMEIFAPPTVRPLMEGADLAIVRLLVEFRQQLYFPGEVDIGSRVVSVGNTSLRIVQGLFVAGSPECATSAEAVCVLLHPGSGTPQPIGSELRAYLLSDALEKGAAS